MKLSNNHIYVLIEARKLINSETEQYLCHALSRVQLRLSTSPQQRRACGGLRSQIHRLLGRKNNSVSIWVLHKDFAAYKDISSTVDGWKQYRLEWIDKMIAERWL